MKIFSAAQIYEADKSTIKSQQISSDELMERASLQLFNWLHTQLKGARVPIKLFCGIGNNGGDGLALARHLREHEYNIGVYVVNYSDKRSEDFLLNLDRLKERKLWPEFIGEESETPAIGKGEIVVDAIFGIGLNRPPADWVGRLISHINESGANVVSVDVPSGLYLDKQTLHTHIVQANVVLSFQSPKLVFFLPDTGRYCEQWEVLDIGLDTGYLENTPTDYQLIGKEDARFYYRPRKRFSHTGTFGHSLIVGGSFGKIGAVQLCARACLTGGSGLVTAFVPGCGYLPMQTAVPEVMVLTDPEERIISSIAIDLQADAVGLGVGIGTDARTEKAIQKFLQAYDGPLVIDADGLNILSENRELLKLLPPKSVLTPHPGELRRLMGSWEGDFDKLRKAREFSKKYDCVLLIKGAHTITLYNEVVYINNSGNPGMATAGSGDALTGIITGLLAQGYPPVEAAIFGVFIHGRAGDIGAAHQGYEALTAGAIIDSVGLAFIDLITEEQQEPGDRET